MDFAESSFQVPSCHTQYEGLKKSMPAWGFGTGTRAQAKKVFISETHTQDIKGTHSPGPVYSVDPNTPGPYWRFGKCPRASMSLNRYPPTSNDLLGVEMPESTEYKHKKPGQVKFGTSLRDAMTNAPGFKGYPPGLVSPGPTQYTPNFYSANYQPPQFSMGAKTKVGLSKYEKRPGPNAYPVPEACGKQYSARKQSKPQWSFGTAPRFGKPKPPGIKDPTGDDDGTLRLKFMRSCNSAPVINFSKGTRDQRQRLALATCKEDKIEPKTSTQRIYIPDDKLPKRHDVLRFTEI